MRKLQEQNPEFHKFDQRHDNFLRWLVEVQDRKTQRGISDAVAIVYATIAIVEDRKRLLSPEQKFKNNWEAFVTHLKWKLLGESTVYQLVYETTSLRMA